MVEKIGAICKIYHYLTITSWKHMLSVVLLLEPENYYFQVKIEK